MGPLLALVLALVFVAVATVLVGSYMFANRRGLAEAAAIDARLRDGGRADLELPSLLRDERASQLPFLDRLLQGRGITEAVSIRLERAGSAQTPGVFLLSAAVSAALGVSIGLWMGGPLGVLIAAAGFAGPWLWLSHAQRKRLNAFETQLPDALDMLANAMRAGYSFQAAARSVSEEMDAPLGPEFGRFYDEQRLGIDVRTALQSMQERIPLLNFRMFVTAVLIQRESGGNLSELLGNLSGLMRERVALQGHIATLTAEPKFSGRVLAVIPVVLFFGLGAIAPPLMVPFKTTWIGHFALVAAAISVVIGYVLMMKIADIDI